MQVNKKQRIARRVFSLTLAATLIFNSFTPANASLQSAIGNIATSRGGMSTAVEPHSFRTATQRGFHGGSINMRFPVKAINLVSVERASVNVGCNGVSMTFGGMAFISADEIIEYLKTIAKGVPALIYSMTLKAIAAPLEASLNKLYATMERLSASLKNSCEASQALVGAIGNINMGGGTTAGEVGAGIAGGLGVWPAAPVVGLNKGLEVGEGLMGDAKQWATGFFDGGVKGVDPKAEVKVKECMALALENGYTDDITKESICEEGGSFRSVYKQVQTIAKNRGVSEDVVWESMKNKQGNITWNALQAYGIAPGSPLVKEGTNEISKSIQGNLDFANLMLSMIGYERKDGDGNSEFKMPSLITGSDVITLFMCGKPQAIEQMAGSIPKSIDEQTAKQRLVTWCQNKMVGFGEKEFYSCPSETYNSKEGNCLNPSRSKLNQFDHAFIGTNSSGGVLFYVADLMNSSVEKAATGQGKFGDEEMMLMVLAPLPLYEIYNIAAATPTIANQLLENNALLISYGIVNATLTGMFGSVMAPPSDGANTVLTSLPAEIHSIMFEMQNDIATSYATDVEYIDFYKKRIDNIVATVKSVNKSVLEGSMALGLNGQTFVEGLSKLR